MPQDAFTLSRLIVELKDKFTGGKINKIVALNSDEIYFTIYTGKTTEKLFISVNPGSPRISVEEVEKESPLTPTNFCMLLRKHLLGAQIEDISIVGFDRIVKIDLCALNEFISKKNYALYVELMGRYSNVILTQDGKVLGGNRGINCFDNGVRPLIVNKPYKLPPTNDKLCPNDVNLIEVLSSKDSENLAEILAQCVQGLSVATANEIALRFIQKHGDFTREKSRALFDFLNEFLFKLRKEPCVYYKDGFPVDVCVFSYQSIDLIRQDFSDVITAQRYYFNSKESAKNYLELFNRLNAIVDAKIKKAKKKLSAINARLKDGLSCEEDRIKGELLLANIYKIKTGDEQIKVVNYYDDSEALITLDKTLSPSQNAEKFYKRYNKKKRAIASLTPQSEQAQSELNYLLKISDFISIAEDIEDLNCIKAELELEGIISIQNRAKKKEQPLKFREYNIDGFSVRVGRNNIENEKLTFTANAQDIWLHAKDYSSSHVILYTNDKKVEQKTLIKVAEICAYYSKGKEAGKVEIVYTHKKNVKKPPKAKIGTAIYSNYNSIVVSPKNHVEFLKTAVKP